MTITHENVSLQQIESAAGPAVALAARVAADTKANNGCTAMAAGRLLAAGISLRVEAAGNAVFEFTTANRWATSVCTLRQRQETAPPELIGKNLGEPYRVPAGWAGGNVVLYSPPPPLPRDTRTAVMKLLETIASDPNWRRSGFRNEPLVTQADMAQRLRRLRRRLSDWAKPARVDAGGTYTETSARSAMSETSAILTDCGANAMIERSNGAQPRTEAVNLSIAPNRGTMPIEDTGLLTRLPPVGAAAGANWRNRSHPGRTMDSHRSYNDTWTALAACDEAEAENPVQAGLRAWDDVLRRVAAHPCWDHKSTSREPDRHPDWTIWPPRGNGA